MKYKKQAFFYLAIIVATILMEEHSFAQIGTWVAAPRSPNNASGGLTLLTDGRVISHTNLGGNFGTHWDRLTPDSTGSYINGTWDVTMAPMLNDRLFFSTQVLQDGRVYVAGGEYGNGDTAAEVYNPLNNTWTRASTGLPHGWQIYDGNSEILYNGMVLEGPQIGASPSFDNLLWSPVTMSFSPAPSSFYNHDEAQWLKLPDSSVLFVGIASNKSNRYIPVLNIWVKDDTVPVKLYDAVGEEAGAALMLPNGKAIFFGATGHNAIYTPSGDTSHGVWTAAADFPKVGAVQV
ncbi:MAG TPA: kelch repeat-containing protein, partial [Bacteroidia bacterium]|nr:kelch repeat-containing protein [Bacteroidia bacterium]